LFSLLSSYKDKPSYTSLVVVSEEELDDDASANAAFGAADDRMNAAAIIANVDSASAIDFQIFIFMPPLFAYAINGDNLLFPWQNPWLEQYIIVYRRKNRSEDTEMA
jgi:hypothetical protein